MEKLEEEEVEVKVKVDEIKVDEVVHQSPLATPGPGHVRTVTRRLEREAVVKLEPHSPPESVSLANRKWKGKGRMIQ